MHNKKLIEIIDLINFSKNTEFTGLGLIIYKILNYLPIEPMNENCFLENNLNESKLIANKLLDISRKEIKCHDGFHLINENIELTGLSYYFSTPISGTLKPLTGKGSRYRTAYYGSLLEDVLCTISISASFEVFIFVNGIEFTLDEYRIL